MRQTFAALAPAAAALVAALGAGAAGAGPWWQAGLGAGAALAAAALAPPPRPADPDPAPAARPGPEHAAARIGLGRRALERLPHAVLLIDGVGRVIFANAAARVLFDRLREGEHFSMSFRAPDLMDALNAVRVAGGARTLHFTLHADRNREIRAWIDGEIGPAEDGRRQGARAARSVLCLFEDRTRELQASRLRTDFIANASHELKTPLASIRGFIETLQGPAKGDQAAQDRFLPIMLGQAERMGRLVDDLLSLNRIELNEHVAPRAVLHLAAVAREVAEALEPVARARGAALSVALEGDGPRVRGDRDELAQAVQNLVENALKYGRGAPVTLALAAPSEDHPRMVGLEVRDTGPGIAREHQPRLTERFFRVPAPRGRDVGGTGLGLAIVKHVMARHRGALGVRSAPGEGAVFTLWLPEVDAPAGRAGPHAAPGGSAGGSLVGAAGSDAPPPAGAAPSAAADAAEGRTVAGGGPALRVVQGGAGRDGGPDAAAGVGRDEAAAGGDDDAVAHGGDEDAVALGGDDAVADGRDTVGEGGQGGARADAQDDVRADARGDVRADARGDARADVPGDARADAQDDARADARGGSRGGGHDGAA